MGFVTKLLTFFIPIIFAMIFYHQRDHILDKKQNDYLDEQFNKIGLQFNYHLDSIVDQMNQYVAETNEIVNTENADDEIDIREKNRLAKEKRIKKVIDTNDQYDEIKINEETVKLNNEKTAASIDNDDKETDEQILKPKKSVEKEQLNNLKDKIQSSEQSKCDLGKDLLLTKEQLKKYDGEDPKMKIYLSFLGIVYDVSKGETHYAPGGAYSMFTGKDASRAFITGDFSESGLIDDLTGLSAESFSGVKEWSDFYAKTYKRVGRLIGAFYDKNGCPTDQIQFLEDQIEKANKERLDDQYENEIFPPCNTEWDQKKKETRFWCTKMSGGVQRDWIGLPRQLFDSNKKESRCACIRDFGQQTKQSIEYADEEDDSSDTINKKDKLKDVGDLNHPRVREYENCNPKSTECVLKTA